MPIYEYRCQSCEHELEKLQRMSDDQLVDCPHCGQPALKRLISAVAFRLKGSGWYETDFKQGQKRNLADSGNDTDSKEALDKKSSSDKNGSKEKSTVSGDTKKPATKKDTNTAAGSGTA